MREYLYDTVKEKSQMTFSSLYIDPGTGSMLFTILIGVLGAGLYSARDAAMKLRFALTEKKKKKRDGNRLPLVIFSDSKRYWNVFAPICEELERQGQEAVYMTASADDPALERSFRHVRCEFIGEGNKAFARLNLLKADVLLSSTPGLDVYQWKRSRDVAFYVHLPHACSDIVLYRMFGLDYYDAVLLSGEYQAAQLRKLERLRRLPEKELTIVGVTYMDAMKRRLQEAAPLPPHPTTVLLAPSWGKSAILSRFGSRIIEALLGCGYHVIIRPHPQSFTSEKAMLERLMSRYPDSEQLEWNRANDNFEVLRRSDILISDFSGVIFDFALVFDRPILYADTSMDLAPYDACWLDEPLWTFSILPQIGEPLTEAALDRLKELIDRCLTDSRYRQGRERARAESWLHSGQAAVRTVDYLLEKCRQLQEQEREGKEGEQA